MPQQTIRTQWHKVMPLIEKDEVYLTAPPGGAGQHWSVFNNEGDHTAVLKKLVKNAGDLPKFVIDPELLKLSSKKEFQASMLDMQKAGVLHLPYQGMIVEAHRGDNHAIVILCERRPEADVKEVKQFHGQVIRICKDEDGEYLVVAALVYEIEVEDRDGEPWVGITGVNINAKSPPDSYIQATFEKDVAEIWWALSASLLLMSTQGVEKEVIETQKLNKHRTLSNKPPIPRHTYIRIGRVYKRGDSDESEEYNPRHSPRPHWRRGHIRMVRYGVGWASVKQVFIPGKLVAFKGHESEPEPSQNQTYIVTR